MPHSKRSPGRSRWYAFHSRGRTQRGGLGYAFRRHIWLVLPILAGCSTVPLSTALPDSTSSEALSAWAPYTLPGKRSTHYTRDAVGLRAEADSSASLYRRAVRVEPAELGRVEFSWLVPALIAGADLTLRDTEDAPVRVMLAFDGDHATLSARARRQFELAEALTGESPPYATLMYVWDNKAQLESVIPGGRSDRIRKIVVDSGPGHLGQWRQHLRQIADDYRHAFGEAPGPLIGVALMTDSDATRSAVTVWYGEVRLVAADGSRR